MNQPQDDLFRLIREHEEAVRRIYEGKSDHLLGHYQLSQSGRQTASGEDTEEALGDARRGAEEARQAAQEALERRVASAKEASINARRDLGQARLAADETGRRLDELSLPDSDADGPGIEEARETLEVARGKLQDTRVSVIRAMADEADALSAEVSFWGTQIRQLAREAQIVAESRT